MKNLILFPSILVLAGLLLWIFPDINYEEVTDYAIPLLGAGLFFPGIPHGALDHRISRRMTDSLLDQFKFVTSYLLMMGMVGMIWLWWVEVGVVLFIVYSAWHFGETDTQSMKIYSPFLAFVFGLGLLTFLLATHAGEFNKIMDQLGSTGLKLSYSQMSVITWASLIALFLPLVHYRKLDFPVWISTVAVLSLSAVLPLLVAFLLYFVGLHSFRGWFDIQVRTGMSHTRMILRALPFSLGAYLLFFLFWWLWDAGQLNYEHMVPALFAFLAAISLPHIYYMHEFYSRGD